MTRSLIMTPHPRFIRRAAWSLAALLALTTHGATLNFQLLTWDDTQATAELPSAAGRKPAAAMSAGDWLVFTADDALLPSANNPAGAMSHNFVDITGAGGSGFNLAPSLSGTLTLQLEAADGADWTVAVTELAYTGHANPMQTMNAFLVTPGSPATTDTGLKVDGAGNAGQWTARASHHWAIQYALDFYFATSADGDPSAEDIDATFNDKPQTGFLIPVNQLTPDGLAAAALDDPLDYYAADFAQYLAEQICPRLPAHATYLLVTQMGKTAPDYAAPGLPITTGSLIGNTTIAYTTQTLAEAPELLGLRLDNGRPTLRFTGGMGQEFALQRSANLTDWETITPAALTYPEPGVVEWTDPAAAPAVQFYRVVAVTP